MPWIGAVRSPSITCSAKHSVITLPDTGATIKISLAGAITTNPVEVTYTVIDQTDVAYKPFGSNARVSASGATTIISAPVSGYTRNLKYFQVFNADTVTTTITGQLVLTGGTSTLFKVALAAGEMIAYTSDAGWRVYNATGGMRIAPLPGTPPIGIGSGNTQGSGPTFAYSDHNHTIRETSGPQDLTMGAVVAADTLTRVGTAIVGKTLLTVRSNSNQVSTAIAAADITGMSIALAKAGTYHFIAHGTHFGASATVALKLALNYSGATSANHLRMFVQTAAGNFQNFDTTVINTLIGAAGANITGVNGYYHCHGFITVSTPGNLVLRMATQTAATAVTVNIDSLFSVQEV